MEYVWVIGRVYSTPNTPPFPRRCDGELLPATVPEGLEYASVLPIPSGSDRSSRDSEIRCAGPNTR